MLLMKRNNVVPFFNAEGLARGASSTYTPIKTVVIPAAGLGSRMYPLTLAVPKPLLPLTTDSLIGHAVKEADKAGAEKIVIVCSPEQIQSFTDQFNPSGAQTQSVAGESKKHFREQIEAYQALGRKLSFVTQATAKGLGNAIYQAKKEVQGTFGVILPDDVILDEDMQQVGLRSLTQNLTGDFVVAYEQVPDEDTHRYGILSVEEMTIQGVSRSIITGMVEKPKSEPPSNLAIMGRYILPEAIFDELENQAAGAGGEIQLTDAMATLLSSDRHVAIAKPYEGKRYDCGTIESYMSSFAILSNKMHQPVSPAMPAAERRP